MGVLKYKNENGDWEAVEIPGVLKYTEQSLTDEQKAQSRANIGAAREPLIVTGNFPASSQKMENGSVGPLTGLSHTWDTVNTAISDGRDVYLRLTSSSDTATFGGWSLKYAELKVISISVPVTGAYTIYAAGIGHSIGSGGQPELVPMHISSNMSSSILLVVPTKS